jgi:hypothetical protein
MPSQAVRRAAAVVFLTPLAFLMSDGRPAATNDTLRISDCAPALETTIREAFREFKRIARDERAALVSCMDDAYLVEHDRRSPATIVGYLTRANVTRVRCRNLPNANASAHRVYLERGVMNIDRDFVRRHMNQAGGARRIASVMAHETMHNNGLNHTSNDAEQCTGSDDDGTQRCVGESIYYNNTVPEQIEACYVSGRPNPWPGPGKPDYVPADIVGLGIDDDNNWSFAWSRDGTVAAGSTTRIHNYRVPYRYLLPEGYTPADIVEMSVDGSNNWTFAWFRDGKVSAGTTEVLDKHRKPYTYALPSGYSPSDIVGIGIDGENNWVFAWYRDGKVSAGTTENLAQHRQPYAYRLPPGYRPSDIVGMAVDGSNNWCFAWYRDGTVSAGTSDNLAAHRKPEAVITGR